MKTAVIHCYLLSESLLWRIPKLSLTPPVVSLDLNLLILPPAALMVFAPQLRLSTDGYDPTLADQVAEKVEEDGSAVPLSPVAFGSPASALLVPAAAVLGSFALHEGSSVLTGSFSVKEKSSCTHLPPEEQNGRPPHYPRHAMTFCEYHSLFSCLTLPAKYSNVMNKMNTHVT